MTIIDGYVRFVSWTEWSKIRDWAKENNLQLGEEIHISDEQYIKEVCKYLSAPKVGSDRGYLYIPIVG